MSGSPLSFIPSFFLPSFMQGFWTQERVIMVNVGLIHFLLPLWTFVNFVQVILFEIDCAIFYTNFHELFCQFRSWTNWVNFSKFMDNCWISCQVTADMKKVYDHLIVINLQAEIPFSFGLHRTLQKPSTKVSNFLWKIYLYAESGLKSFLSLDSRNWHFWLKDLWSMIFYFKIQRARSELLLSNVKISAQNGWIGLAA